MYFVHVIRIPERKYTFFDPLRNYPSFPITNFFVIPNKVVIYFQTMFCKFSFFTIAILDKTMLDIKTYLLEAFSASNKTGQNNNLRPTDNLQNIVSDLRNVFESKEQINFWRTGMKNLRYQLYANGKIWKSTTSISMENITQSASWKLNLHDCHFQPLLLKMDICTHLIKVKARKKGQY